jgi:hypothetical protein
MIRRRHAAFAATLTVAAALAPAPSLAVTPPREPLPEPLALEQALALGEGHPRLGADADLAARFPPRGTLYLDCHRLAFAEAGRNPDRDRPLEPLLDPGDAQRLEILIRFLDALLADQAFATHSEAMAVAYIQFDRAAVRRDLGQVNELRVLELESVYQEVLQQRTAAELAQQLARTLLIKAIDRPGTLPRDLVPPELPTLPDPLPEAENLIRDAAAGNPVLRAIDEGLGESDRRLLDLELRQQVLELELRLRALGAAGRQVRTESAYRDLKLDESRTLYDQEVTADLGYSMSQQTRTRMLETRIGYCRAIAWAELNALAGHPPWPTSEKNP